MVQKHITCSTDFTVVACDMKGRIGSWCMCIINNYTITLSAIVTCLLWPDVSRIEDLTAKAAHLLLINNNYHIITSAIAIPLSLAICKASRRMELTEGWYWQVQVSPPSWAGQAIILAITESQCDPLGDLSLLPNLIPAAKRQSLLFHSLVVFALWLIFLLELWHVPLRGARKVREYINRNN